MPCGPALIEAVAAILNREDAQYPSELACRIGGHVTNRAIRYAISELIKSGRAKRKGRRGPVYAVRAE